MIKSDGEGDEFEFAFAAREDWTASIISSIGGNESMRAFPSRFGSQSFPVGFAASRSVPPSVQLEPRGGGGGARAEHRRILVLCVTLHVSVASLPSFVVFAPHINRRRLLK